MPGLGSLRARRSWPALPTGRGPAVPDGVRNLATSAHEVAVLLRAGMLHLNRPDQAVAALIYVRQRGLMAGLIRIATMRTPDEIGLIDEQGPLTFADLDRRSNALARAWRDRGLDETSAVALLCRDHRGLVEAMFALGKLGATALLMNTGFARPQFAAVCEREGATALVYDEEFVDVLADVPPDLPRYLAWVSTGADAVHPTLDGLIASASDADLPRPGRVGSLTLLTSGTTGVPKGASRSISSPLAAAQFIDRIPLRAHERTLLAAPLFHATGLSQFVLTMSMGSTTVLRRRFDPLATVQAIERHRINALVLVPTMLQRILALGDEELARHDMSSLRIVFTSGSALPPEVGNRAMQVWGNVIYNLYGSTEVAVATVATPADWRLAPGTVGRCPVGSRVVLYDQDGRPITAPNVPGRIFVGSGLRFPGYTGGGTKDEIDGLLSSGDVGHWDEHGLLFIDGRDDDMIISGGENIYPAEVENLLLEQPGIADVAVVGVPDDEFGQRLKAFVVVAPDRSLTADDVREHVRRNLARHKVPREVEFRDALPRNATGKLLRHQLTADV